MLAVPFFAGLLNLACWFKSALPVDKRLYAYNGPRFTTYSRKPPPPPPPPCEDRLRLLVPWAADPCAQLLALGPFSTPGSKGARVAVDSQRPDSLAADIDTQDTCEECTATGGHWQVADRACPLLRVWQFAGERREMAGDTNNPRGIPGN
jgi:hypothetical protein